MRTSPARLFATNVSFQWSQNHEPNASPKLRQAAPFFLQSGPCLNNRTIRSSPN